MNSNQKEEFRFIFAGMALQGMLASGKGDEYKMKNVAIDAVLYAILRCRWHDHGR